MTKVSKEYQKQRMSYNLRPPIMKFNKLFIPIFNYNGYYINMDGDVYSEVVDRILKVHNNGKGYMLAHLVKNNGKSHSKKVHQLVTQTFFYITEENLVPNHKNFNRSDNRVTNLELITPQENMNHRNESIKLSARKTKLKWLTKEEVINIYFANGTYAEIAKDFGVTIGVVTNIKLKKTYVDITSEFKNYNKRSMTKQITQEEVYKLYIKYLGENVGIKDLTFFTEHTRTAIGQMFSRYKLPKKDTEGNFKMSLRDNYENEEDSRLIRIWLNDYLHKEVGIPYLVKKHGRSLTYYNENFKRLNLPIKDSHYYFKMELSKSLSTRMNPERVLRIWLTDYLKNGLSAKAIDRKYQKNDYFNGRFKSLGLPKKDRYGFFKMKLNNI